MKQKKFNVVGMGDLVADLMVSVDGFPINADSAQLTDKVELQPGGMGNFLIAGQRIGLSMLPIDLLGADQNGEFLIEVLKDEGIETSFLEKIPGAGTREIIVLANEAGKHAFIAYRDEHFPVRGINNLWQRGLEKADALLTVGYSLSEQYIKSALIEAMEFVRRRGKKVFFDPGPLIDLEGDDAFRRAFNASDVVLLTDDELELATGGRTPQHARKLFEYGVELVCVKLGKNGNFIVDQDQEIRCPGFEVQVCDTNGAGDSFAAAFIYGYLYEWPLLEVGTFANVMGAVKVQKFGAGRNVPTANEIKKMIDVFNISLPDYR